MLPSRLSGGKPVLRDLTLIVEHGRIFSNARFRKRRRGESHEPCTSRLESARPRAMVRLRKLGIVARFELRDALRSKLVIVVVGLFGAGAGLGCFGFIKALQAAEASAREFLAKQGGVAPEVVPMEDVENTALQGIFSSFENEGVRDTLSEMQPLAIFFGVAASYTIPLLVLALSSGAHAGDIQSGAARFTLFRCDRMTWALGKMLGHLCLLALGLFVAALVAGTMGALLQPEFAAHTWSDLLFASLRALVFGAAYLGIFSGVSLTTRSPLKARAFSLLTLIACGAGHLIASSSESALSYARWLFPGQYELGLWNADLLTYLGSVAALLLLGGIGFALGANTFLRRDA